MNLHKLDTAPVFSMRTVLIATGAALLLFLLLKLTENPSISEHIEAEYSIIYGLLLLLSLTLTKKLGVTLSCWKTLSIGIASLLIISLIAMPLATLVGLDDGLERLTNSYSLAGLTGILITSIVYSLFNGALLIGLGSHWLTWKYS